MKSDTLQLNLKREFFADIASGNKTIEYRRRIPYWEARLEGRTFTDIRFRKWGVSLLQFGDRRRSASYGDRNAADPAVHGLSDCGRSSRC